ncbi:MAG: hypothetical protein U0871_12370 [Gemmataceae bacterium]
MVGAAADRPANTCRGNPAVGTANGARAAAAACGVGYRSAGFRASIRRMTAARPGGTSGRTLSIGRGSRACLAASFSAAGTCPNGGWPASRKYRVQPSPYTSARVSTAELSTACSGAR